MFEMYDSGVVMRADQLTMSMQAFGQDLAGVTKLMTKHGQVISSMGIAKTMQLGQAFTELTAGGTQLGMTQEQSNETLLTYTEILNTSGRLRNLNELTVANGAKEFANQLNLASQATGKNREQIQQEIKDRLKQNDIAFLRLHLSEEENAALTKQKTALEKFGAAGDTLFDNLAQFKTQGFAAVDESVRTALGGEGRLLFEQLSRADTSEEVDAAVRAISETIKNNPLDISQGGKLSPNYDASLFQGAITQAYELARPALENATDGQAAPIDETAAQIKEQQQNVTQAMNKVQGAMIDLSVVAAQNLMPQIQAVGTELKYLSDDMAGLARSMVGVSVLDDETIRALVGAGLVGAGGAAAIAAFGARGASSTGGPARSPSPGAAAAAAADDALKAESWFTRLGRSLKFITGGFLLEEIGGIVAGAGYERTGAGLEAGGSAIMDTAIARALIKSPLLAFIAGTTFATATNLDNIGTFLGIGGNTNPAATPTVTSTTATDGTETIDTTTVAPEQELALSITALASEVESARLDSNRRDQSMSAKFDKMVELLTTLNTNINDQTIILKNAYNNGTGNVYP
jgi:hypothetical protein